MEPSAGDWLNIPLEGMRGDPDTVTGGETICHILQDAELGFQRFQPRLDDVYDLKQPSVEAERVYGLYWVPFPIEYPLIQAWLGMGLGPKGVYYVPSQSAGYFLLNRNLWLVVRFVGFLQTPSTLSDTATNIVVEATEPTEFYEWMTSGELQIVQKVGDEYRSEVVRYTDALVNLQREFRAKITLRGQRGTTPKSWDTATAPVRLYTVHVLQNSEAPTIKKVVNRDALHAKLDPNIDPETQSVWDNDLNEWYDRPVLVAPTLLLHRHNLYEYTNHTNSEGVAFYEYHRRRSNPAQDRGNRYAFGPRRAHNDDSSHRLISPINEPYPDPTFARRTNYLGNNWDAYLMSGDAYWRSLAAYLTNSFDEFSPAVLLTGDSGPIPHADYKTMAGGKYYFCMRTMVNGETERVRFLYRFLRNPMVDARARGQYTPRDMSGISVIQFEEIRIWGAPVAARENLRSVFRFAIHNGLPPSDDPIYQTMEQITSGPYAQVDGWCGVFPSQDLVDGVLKRRLHMIPEPQYAEVDWDSATVEEHRRTYGEINRGEGPLLEVVLRNVRCNIRDLERNEVWAWEFQPLFLGTGRTPGRSTIIGNVWNRAYAHSGVLTHCALAIGLTPSTQPERRNFWEFKKAWNDTADQRRVFVFSPSYAGRVRGRVRIYTAILWKGGAPSAAAFPYTANFNADYASPILEIQVPSVNAGDKLVVYVFENQRARAVAEYTFTTASASPQTVEVADTDETLPYPYVNATAAFPYGPAISYEGRIIVLDNSVWVSSRSDYPQFSVYPIQEEDGFRILVSDPVERLMIMDGHPIVVGPRQAYRLVIGRNRLGGGEAVPFPTSIQSDMPKLSVPNRLEDYDSFVTREGLVSERGIVYKLAENWYREDALRGVWVVRTPYGAALVRHYGNRIIIAHPALTVNGYQWTTLQRESGDFPDLRDVQWVGGLTLLFVTPVNSAGHCAIRLRQATTRVPHAVYRILGLKQLHGLRPKQIELFGSCSVASPIRVRLYRSNQTQVQELTITQSYRPFTFQLTGHKLDAPYWEFEVTTNAVWDGAQIRLGSGGMP